MLSLFFATALLNSEPTQKPEPKPQDKQERIIVGGYNADGSKAESDEDQIRKEMQRRIDALNEHVKKLEGESVNDKKTGPNQQVKPNDKKTE